MENNRIESTNKETVSFIKEWKGIVKNAVDIGEIHEIISTGSLGLDNAIGINGIPVGRIIEIYGNESCGKTTIALQIIKEAQKKNKKCLFIDAEHSLDVNYVKSLGVDLTKLLVATPYSGEQAFDIIENTIKNKIANFIVVDSVAALVPQCEIDSKVDEYQMGAHARLMSKGLRKIQMLMDDKITIIFLNQIREKIGIFFGNPEVTPGGKALKFFSSIRLEVRKSDLIKDNNNKIGIRSKITVVKNKLSPPLKSSYIDIYFNQGYDSVNEFLTFAIDYGIIKKNGSWFSYDNNNLCQGREQLKKLMLENIEFFNNIKNEVIKNIENDRVQTIDKRQ